MHVDDTIELEDVAALGGEPTQSRDLRAQGRQTLRRLLEAGQQVVEQQGHDQARVDDIVELAGLSHGTFYLYFSDREDLLRRLVRLVGRQMKPLADSLPPLPTREGLARWIESLITEFDKHAELLRAARALSTDEAVSGLVAPLTRWFDQIPGAVAPELSAALLLWHIERAAVRDDIVDHDALAAAILRSVGSTSGESLQPDTELQAA